MSHSERRHEAAYLDEMELLDEAALKRMHDQGNKKSTAEIIDAWRADITGAI